MIVSEIMTTKLITVSPDDTLSHAANLMRQHQFHQVPIVRTANASNYALSEPLLSKQILLFEGLVTAQDINLAVAADQQRTAASGDTSHSSWHEQRVSEIMHRASIRVSPTTSVAAVAQILVERGLNSLPVVEYIYEKEHPNENFQGVPMLMGLVTRSDLLMTFARSLGSFEPGMQVIIGLPLGNLQPLVETLVLATELHLPVRSIIAAPVDGVLQTATIRLGTINPTPLLVRLQDAHIQYTFVDPLTEESNHVQE